MTERELLDRETRAAERRVKDARFPVTKTIDTFDFKALPSINEPLVRELLRGVHFSDSMAYFKALPKSGLLRCPYPVANAGRFTVLHFALSMMGSALTRVLLHKFNARLVPAVDRNGIHDELEWEIPGTNLHNKCRMDETQAVVLQVLVELHLKILSSPGQEGAVYPSRHLQVDIPRADKAVRLLVYNVPVDKADVNSADTFLRALCNFRYWATSQDSINSIWGLTIFELDQC